MCGVDRTKGQFGKCRMNDKVSLARAALHFWEEPPISGNNGSGAVFFSGCGLGCVYCQNKPIASGETACEITAERLCQIYFELADKGAHNINLVSASHFLPDVIKSIEDAKYKGLKIPFVYNTSGYERVESIKMLDGLVDIYLPDYKYADRDGAAKYSFAPDYPDIAIAAIDEMVRQKGKCVFSSDGTIQSGVIIRHLLLPGRVIQSKMAVKKLYKRYENNVRYSLMSQYTPLKWVDSYPELGRRVTCYEYKSLCEYAVSIGIDNAYIQTVDSANEKFIPEFDFEGL